MGPGKLDLFRAFVPSFHSECKHRNETSEDPYTQAVMWENQCFTGNSGDSFRLRLVGTNDGIKVWNGPGVE